MMMNVTNVVDVEFSTREVEPFKSRSLCQGSFRLHGNHFNSFLSAMVQVAVYCGSVVKQFRLFVYHLLVVAKKIRVLFVEWLIPKSLDILP